MEVTILSYKGKVFAVEPPTFVELEVTYTEPGFAGNTTTTSGKPATLETGLELQVPMVVNIGDILKIDTRTCEQMERVQEKIKEHKIIFKINMLHFVIYRKVIIFLYIK